MSDDLIQEMSTRLGRTAPDVEKAFAAFASALQDRVRSEGEANLAGLGMIRSEPGGPRFEPSDALYQAVNYRWLSAGAPVAITSAWAVTALSVVPPAASSVAAAQASEPDPGPDSDASTPISVDLPPELLEEPPMPDDQKPIRKVSWAPIDEVDPTDLAGSTAKPDPTPPAPVPAPAAPPPPPLPPPLEAFMPPVASAKPGPGAPPPTPPVPSEDALVDDLTYESLHQKAEAPGGAATTPGAVAASAASGAAASASAGAARPARAGSRRSSHARRSGAGEAPNRKPLFIILGLLAIVAVGWILINQFGGGSDSADPAVAETENVTENPVVVSEDPEVDPAGASTIPSTSEEPPPQPSTPVATSTAASIDPNSSGYTLIVGSSLSRASAETEMNRFSNLGHPVALLSYPDGDGQARHRIAVGEFATADEADSARQAMANRLPDGTWVRRIRR